MTDSTSNNEYRYLLSIRGCGSEMVAGTVSTAFADFWLSKSPRELGEYLTLAEDERPAIDDAGFVSCPWHEIDDLGHANGPYINAAKLNVYDVSKDELCFSTRGLSSHDGFDCSRVLDVRTKRLKKDYTILKTQVHETNWMTFDFITDRPFTPKLLSFTERSIDGLSHLDTVSYDDTELNWMDWVTERTQVTAKVIR